MCKECKVYIGDKRIVGITKKEMPKEYPQQRKDAKVYVLDDGTFVRSTSVDEFNYVCDECGKQFESKTRPDYGFNFGKEDEKPYICNRCRGLNHNPFKGKKHTDEYKKRMSEERKGVWGIGEKNAMYGVSWKDLVTPEVIAEHSRKLSERFSGEKNPMYGKNWKDYTTQEVIDGHRQKQIDIYQNLPEEEKERRRQRMAENDRKRREDDPEKYREEKSRAGKIGMSKREAYTKTQPEIIVENWLNENNIPNEYSPIMGDGNRNYQYDFIIKGKRILVEVNGDYWHGNPNKFNLDGSDGKRKLNDIQITKIETDELKLEFAKSHNFEVIYIWEEEINNGDFSKLYFLKDN